MPLTLNHEGDNPRQRLPINSHLNTMMVQGRSFSGHERNCCFLNLGAAPVDSGRFANISSISGIDFPDDARGMAIVDWDRDGDVDLWISNRTAPRVRLMRNDATAENNFLALKLNGNGTTTNRDAIGARVDVVLANPQSAIANPKLIKTLRAGESYVSQSTKWLHFGLGSADQVEKVVVHWPAGEVEEFTSVEPNKRYQLVQDTGTALPLAAESPEAQLARDEPTTPSAATDVRIPLVTLIPMPRLACQSFDGEIKKVAFGNGKSVLLNLWASWCEPCLGELKEITERQQEIRAAGLDVIAIAVDGVGSDRSEPRRARQAAVDLTFPFTTARATVELLDRLQAIHDLQVGLDLPLPVPTSFLVDGSGRLLAIYRGSVAIDQVLADVKLAATGRSERLVQSTGLSGSKVANGHLEQMVNDEDASIMYQSAAQFSKFGDIDATRRALHEVVELAPDFAPAQNHLGTLYVRLRKAKLAEKHLREAIRAKPDYTEALNTLGTLCASQNRLTEAMSYFEQVLESDSKNLNALFNLGGIFMNNREWKRAKVVYDTAIELKPDDPQLLNNRGLVNEALGQYKLAIEDFSTSVGVQPENVLGHGKLALLLAASPDESLRDAERAISHGERACELSGHKDIRSLISLAAAYAEAQRFDDAILWQTKAINLARPALKPRLQENLGLYQSGKPYRYSAQSQTNAN